MRRWTSALVVGAITVGLSATQHAGGTLASETQDGALVRTTASSTVGVVLDEIPRAIRARVAKALIVEPDEFWMQRAVRQLRLANYNLAFRGSPPEQQLPLPPEPLWTITLGKPTRQRVQGHDVVVRDYRFSSVLLTDAASPGRSEPKLDETGGTLTVPFILPVDPELILQRTGFACLNEVDFPFHSVDSEEVDSFYDQEARVEEELSNQGKAYHYTRLPDESCLQALKRHIGRVDMAVKFERLRWDSTTADEFRYGEVTGETPDLKVYQPDFAASRITYRYVSGTSCDIVEGSVGGTGWRRLLQFSTSDENVGNQPLVIGHIDYYATGKPKQLDAHNVFEFSPCHRHYHFKYYGDLAWGDGGPDDVNSKRGFCLQSTERVANREGSPLSHPFGTCHNQGVTAGWVDQYKAGLPSQWVDITTFPEGAGARTFTSNPQGFLCEGTFLNADGAPLGPNEEVVWVQTGLIAENGKPVEIQKCQLAPGWDANNRDSVDEVVPPPGEGLITTECTRGQIGPLRNCGFDKNPAVVECAAGERTTATFAIPPDAAPQVVRITEFSHMLNAPIPARFEDSWVPIEPGVSDAPYMLANKIVTASAPKTVTFTCPAPRTDGAPEPGGTYSIYSGPVFPDDAAAPLTRT